ncbi:hypothetical protein [Spongiactinospora sp. TRM90649]|uniref:hypothetical protein n=1 Tax=Spongiactinospora sp. TRM90649 TaxID=3031114 RepID=UPI0023F867C7|nr:hypothetical protein [Spongiactinospora sp. TRM90649]MDF5758391.1 hypothetical protein [Spongiactinospora sp. TRM90649]
MGTAKQTRNQRRKQAGGPAGGRVITTLADIEQAGEEFMNETSCRLTYLNDPVIGSGQPVSGLGPDGQLLIDDSGTVEPIPAVLFEPSRAIVRTDRETGLILGENRTEAIVASGFHPLPPGPIWVAWPALGWGAYRTNDGVVLRDANGVIWASGALTLDPAWVSAATSYGHVVAFYGPKLGVRTPPGLAERAYTTAKRRAEFLQGRAQGLTTVATVTWHGAAEEDLEWVVGEAGSYGQPLPVVFAPAADFRMHGGPDMFGLTPVQLGGSVPTAPTSNLIAHISRTDVDLICPTEPEATSYVAGVHYGEGLTRTFRRAAAQRGAVLLLTGPRLPGKRGVAPEQSWQDVWGAVVKVEMR